MNESNPTAVQPPNQHVAGAPQGSGLLTAQTVQDAAQQLQSSAAATQAGKPKFIIPEQEPQQPAASGPATSQQIPQTNPAPNPYQQQQAAPPSTSPAQAPLVTGAIPNTSAPTQQAATQSIQPALQNTPVVEPQVTVPLAGANLNQQPDPQVTVPLAGVSTQQHGAPQQFTPAHQPQGLPPQQNLPQQPGAYQQPGMPQQIGMPQQAEASQPLGATQPYGSQTQGGFQPAPKKKGLSPAATMVLASILIVGLIIAGVVLAGKMGDRKVNKVIEEISQHQGDDFPLTQEKTKIILDLLSSTDTFSDGQRTTFLHKLRTGKSIDGSNVSSQVTQYIRSEYIGDELSERLIVAVVHHRANKDNPSEVVPHLIDFIKNKENSPRGKTAALKAAGKMASPSNFGDLMAIVTTSEDAGVRNQASLSLAQVIKKSPNPSSFSNVAINASKNAIDDSAKAAALRIVGASGGGSSATFLEKVIRESNNSILQAAALNALGNWPDDSRFEDLLEYTKNFSDQPRLRRAGFDSMHSFLTKGPKISPEDQETLWGDLAKFANNKNEQRKVINSVIKIPTKWANRILLSYENNGADDNVQGYAQREREKHDELLKNFAENEPAE